MSNVTSMANGRWVSEISIKGCGIYLGTFGTEEEAHKAYQTACLMENEFDGNMKRFRASVLKKAGIKLVITR